MKVISNEKLIKRNNRIGQVTSIGSLVILAVGMFFSFKDKDGTYMVFTFSSLIVGFILFQIGNFFLNRWGKSPRPDESITQSLKGLDDKYSLYHYSTDLPHLLVGPAGMIALLPYNQGGLIKFDTAKNQWKQIGGNFFLKVFGQEGLGRPIAEAKYTSEEIERYLLKIGVSINQVKATSLLVFTNTKATIEGEGSPVPYSTTEKLKDTIRKKAKETNFNAESLIAIIEAHKKLK